MKLNQTGGRLGQAQGMVLDLFITITRIWNFGPNLVVDNLLLDHDGLADVSAAQELWS